MKKLVNVILFSLMFYCFSVVADVGFSDWSKIANGRLDTPVLDKSTSLNQSWVGATGETINLSVRQPVVSNQTEIIIQNMEGDSRPVFEAALLKARSEGINKINVSKGTYNFLTTGSTNDHLTIAKAKDLIIDGNGSTFVFHKDLNGLVVRQSRRVLIRNVTLRYGFLTSSVGIIDSNKKLVVDSKYTVSASDKIYQLAEVDSNGIFVPGGVRLITPPGSVLPLFEGSNTYSHSNFSKLLPGTRLAAIHQWYGGVAVRIDGDRDEFMTEDINLSNVTINNTSGMGIVVTGLKRGFALIDSKFEADGALSSSWDGLHIISGGGDILIKGNTFSKTGDDAVNISNPVHKISAINSNMVTLSNSSRFIAINDTLTFFDQYNKYLGKSLVLTKTDKGAGVFDFTLDSVPVGVTTKSSVRDAELIASRYAVIGNRFENINIHGLLAQIPNGLIDGNTFSNLGKNAIRLLSSLSWVEGVGAFNVVVKNNIINAGGTETGFGVNWGAISVYGQNQDQSVSENLVNENVLISNNVISGLKQKCISTNNTKNAIIMSNICN